MAEITIVSATEMDRAQLRNYFKHYQAKESIHARVDCYTTHNITLLAKDNEDIVGVIQWTIKENPQSGVAEFEELHVQEAHRGKKIGSTLIKTAIQSVKDQFKRMGIKPRKVYLFASKQNTIARAVYEKAGFKLIAEVGDLFSDDAIELFYVLDL
jgi:ribosomal protein S18 acetylase RimI-like enzyme